jgi:hypothetical protein
MARRLAWIVGMIVGVVFLLGGAASLYAARPGSLQRLTR